MLSWTSSSLPTRKPGISSKLRRQRGSHLLGLTTPRSRSAIVLPPLVTRGEFALPLHDDDSERPNTLPRPELNPLLNPLLSRNMGRWAEVYFTSPPEKREQAVMELLAELRERESLKSSVSSAGGDQTPETAQRSGSSPEPADSAHSRVGDEGRSGDARLLQPAPASKRHRVYAGVILVAASLAVAYGVRRVWRVEPRPPLPKSTPTVVTRPPANPAQASGAARSHTAGQHASVSTAVLPPEDADAAREPGMKAAQEKPAPDAFPAPASVATISPTGPFLAAGALELARAKSYLNGDARDSKEAVKWLWQAVAKQNAEATLLLSDLYLKGEGVAKNCDQARVLLESAARRGVKEAAQRLQNLPTAGCE